jgi:predicted small metal-binding protein
MKISEETFKKMLKEIPLSMENKSYEEQAFRIIKELSIKISHEITPMPNEDFNKISQRILNKTSEDIFKKIMEGLPEILSDKIIRIKYYHCGSTGVISDLLFKHCFQRDDRDGTPSPEER